ncbi:MAG: acyl-CoA dehydrogenase family protein [Piscinibacter sp.]
MITQGLARYNPSVALTYAAHENLCLNNIARNAGEDMKQRYLPGLCDGTKIGALGLTEPGAGSDALGSMATTARRDGDHYVLNGRKLYITNGPVADVAARLRQDRQDEGRQGHLRLRRREGHARLRRSRRSSTRWAFAARPRRN